MRDVARAAEAKHLSRHVAQLRLRAADIGEAGLLLAIAASVERWSRLPVPGRRESNAMIELRRLGHAGDRMVEGSPALGAPADVDVVGEPLRQSVGLRVRHAGQIIFRGGVLIVDRLLLRRQYLRRSERRDVDVQPGVRIIPLIISGDVIVYVAVRRDLVGVVEERIGDLVATLVDVEARAVSTGLGGCGGSGLPMGHLNTAAVAGRRVDGGTIAGVCGLRRHADLRRRCEIWPTRERRAGLHRLVHPVLASGHLGLPRMPACLGAHLPEVEALGAPGVAALTARQRTATGPSARPCSAPPAASACAAADSER